jgi:hypothetical protein
MPELSQGYLKRGQTTNQFNWVGNVGAAIARERKEINVEKLGSRQLWDALAM